VGRLYKRRKSTRAGHGGCNDNLCGKKKVKGVETRTWERIEIKRAEEIIRAGCMQMENAKQKGDDPLIL